jgi:hypothetical protein
MEKSDRFFATVGNEEDGMAVPSNLVYDYEITTPDKPDENNCLCNFNDVGTVVVPAGSTQTFNIASERPPTETPESE